MKNMCGIAGYIGRREVGAMQAEKYLALMGNRRPDTNDLYRHSIGPGRNVLLIHSNLFMTDQDAQLNSPLHIGSKVLAYNGRLYNCPELKEELSKRDHDFATESDTEILLRTIMEFGWQKGLDKCEGTWSLGVYDENTGSIVLSRDRFGEKSLYLYRDSTGVYFGSEVKFIFALLGHNLEVNYDHLYRYMVNGYKSLYKCDETFFRGVWELPPASTISIDKSGSEIQNKYWQPTFEQDDSMDYDQAVEGVRSGLIRSVELRLRAEAPLAFCMSGGIDSNSIIGIAKRVFDYDVHGFTIVNEDERYEEWEFIEHSVEQLGIRHMPVSITKERFRENLTKLIRHHDAPVYTISYYVHWLLMAHIAKYGYRISVGGAAADELLTGYYDHHNLYLYEIRNTPFFVQALEGWHKRISPIVRNPYLKNPHLYFEDANIRDHVYLNNRDFAQYLVNDWWEDFTEANYTNSLLRNRMLNELFHESGPVMLHEDALNSMYYSIENMSPFLDRELFEFCYRIPSKYLVRDGFAKVVLRDAMSGIVPDRILWNPRKVGFNAPILSLLDVKDPEMKSYLLDESPIFDHIKRDKMEKLISNEFLPNSESKFLFYFLCSKIFIEEFSK